MSLALLPLAGILGLGGPELMIIFLIIMLLFGGAKLPGLAKGLGQSIKEFKKAASGVESEIRRAMEEEPPTPPAPKPVATIQQTPPPPPEKTALPPPSAD